MEKYETIEQLGEGAFAVVTKARDTVSGSLVAIKKLKKKYQTWQECVDLREVKSLNVLKKNENIIKLKEMVRVEDTLYLVFEYMEKNLLELILDRQSKKFNESQIRCIIWQILQGLVYMHKYGFFHRDLKPENLLVCGEVVKIGDFGLAREIRSLPPYTDYVSTRYYRAPECILKSTNYNSRIDIWALGCIMIEMYNQKPVFVGNSEKVVLFRICSVLGSPTNTTWSEGIQMAKKIELKFPNCAGVSFSQVVPDASNDALDFLANMLKWDPNKRSSASDLLNHPFFTKYPIPNRISTPEYSTSNIVGKNVKTYSNINKNHPPQIETKIKGDFEKKDDTDFSSLLNDTKGFNECKI
jgi:serine/threonine protein kinase